MASFQSGGLTLAYDDARPVAVPSGVIVLVHGFATNRTENWRRLGWYAAFERRGYRVIAPDLRGHGDSDKPHEPSAYERAAMAEDIVALLDHLDLSRADLMGYSMGAHLSLAVARGHPRRITNLILGGIGGRMLAEEARTPDAMSLARAMRIEDPAVIGDPILKGFRRFAESQGEDRLALAACAEGRGTPWAPSDLAAISVPTLVVAGEADKIAGDPRVLADAIPGAKSVSLPACDHFSAIPHALFKAAAFDFLDGWLD
jgi:pimeloyl-ACP methyl ester carboxylesterase